VDFVIRKWNDGDDIECLTQLVNRAYSRLKEQGLNYVGTYQDSIITENRMEGGQCWVAVRENLIVGSVMFYPAGFMNGCPYYASEQPAVFGQFAVDPDFQGQGIGRALLDRIETEARDSGAVTLACDTSEQAAGLIELYKKWGFEIVGAADWRPHVNYLSVILARSL
jgi:GNAT superfamily N-acetyltransferase